MGISSTKINAEENQLSVLKSQHKKVRETKNDVSLFVIFLHETISFPYCILCTNKCAYKAPHSNNTNGVNSMLKPYCVHKISASLR